MKTTIADISRIMGKINSEGGKVRVEQAGSGGLNMYADRISPYDDKTIDKDYELYLRGTKKDIYETLIKIRFVPQYRPYAVRKNSSKKIRLGKHEAKALDFALRVLHSKANDFSRSWHSFAKDSTTKKSVSSLAKKGLVEVNKFGQFRPTIKAFNESQWLGRYRLYGNYRRGSRGSVMNKKTRWQLFGYDVWGNSNDGWEVNMVLPGKVITLTTRAEGEAKAFDTAMRRAGINLRWGLMDNSLSEEDTLYFTGANGKPLGELRRLK